MLPVTMAQAFASIAQGFSAAGLGCFYDATVKWPGTPVTDAGGSIVTPGTPVEASCSVQVDQVTEAMRQADGFTDRDVRLLVLCATLEPDLDTDAVIEVSYGPNAGTWMLASCAKDPAGIYWDCRGRRA